MNKQRRLTCVLFSFFFLMAVNIQMVTCATPINTQNKQYESYWKQVTSFIKADRPQSALNVIATIEKQAQADKNSVQHIKARVLKMKLLVQKDPDQLPSQLAGMEVLTAKTTDKTEKAILQSILAEMYLDYYGSNSYIIDKRTDIEGQLPTNLTEWSATIFSDTICTLLAQSLKPAERLQSIPVETFREVLTDINPTLEPTLYDILARRRITLLDNLGEVRFDGFQGLEMDSLFVSAHRFVNLKLDKTKGTYIMNDVVATFQQWLQFRLRAGKTKALIHTDVYRLQTLYTMVYSMYRSDQTKALSVDQQTYLNTLQELSVRYATNELVLEVLLAQAEFYMAFYTESNSLFKAYKSKAYKLTISGLKRFPTSAYNKKLKTLQQNMMWPGVNISSNAVVKRNSPLEVNVHAENTDKVELVVFRVNLTPMVFLKKRNNRKDSIPAADYTVLEKRTVSLKKDTLLNPVDTTLIIKGMDYGQYGYKVLIPGSRDVTTHAYFVVSDMASIALSNESQLYVVDRVTGKPIPDVNVQVYINSRSSNSLVDTLYSSGKTDKEGHFYYKRAPDYINNVLFYERGADRFLTSHHDYYRNYGDNSFRENRRLSLLTDRSIYRPGQTVYFKGIAYEVNKDIQRVLSTELYDVELKDANRQTVGKKTVMTNEFGSFSGSFVLPETGLNGYYRLDCGASGGTSFRVEDYKRPTFEVKLKKPETALEFGKTITVTGTVNAFAGYPVSGATVTYQVFRRSHYRSEVYVSREAISTGKVQAQADGTFSLTFTAERLKTATGVQILSYDIEATVTDQKGETQEAAQTLCVGDKLLFIDTNLSSKTVIDKTEGKPIKVRVETINGASVPAEVGYELYLLDSPRDFTDVNHTGEYEEIVFEDNYEEPQRNPGRLVRSGRFQTNDNPLMLDFKTLESGMYELVCTTMDSRGQQERSINGFSLYAPDDTHVPEKAYVWMVTPNTTFKAGKPGIIRFGTAASEVYVLYRIMKGKTCLDSTWIPMSDTLRTFTIPYMESYGDGVTVQFAFVKNEKLFTRSVTLTYEMEKKKLTPTLSVFRDKLRPGETAEWTITIPEVKTLNKPAEILAGMYDASLDNLLTHSFSFSPVYHPNPSYSGNWAFLTSKTESDEKLKYVYFRINTVQNLCDFDFAWKNGIITERTILHFTVPEITDEEIPEDEALRSQDEVVSVMGYDEVNGVDIVDVEKHKVRDILDLRLEESSAASLDGLQQAKPEITPRRIFNETAFFYPHLLTDEAGNVKFTFTVPESLTRWNVNLLAHTKDLYFGSFKTQVETQKELMVQLNLPRFVRQSDKPVLSAIVVNLSDTSLTTNVSFELLNPEDNKPLTGSINGQATQTITLAPHETRAVSWNLNARTSTDLVVCKVVASSGTFSDGEQQYLPVLPDRQLITETLPLSVSVNQTKQYTLEQVVNPPKGVTPHALTVEFSPNPSWTAIQALPSVAEPSDDNAFDYFTACYVNTLAGHIVQSYPKLSAVFEQWRKTGNSSTLLSTLSKNQELKTLLLEETPWVVAANDETEQRRQLALLFDLNQQKNQLANNWKKLLKLQQASGGFAWFEDMPANRYVTYYILLNQARLNALVNPFSQTDNALLRALAYADKSIADDYAALKQQPKVNLSTMHIGDMQWFYLHLRSMYPSVKLPEASKEAVAYYTKQAETYWTQATLYGKAATALIAVRNGNKTLGTAILTALKEQSLTKEDMGMYWAANKAGYGWNERPVMVQTMLLEAFAELEPKTAPLDAMKTWLLRQKQTQRWDSPLSTVDAIYALLHYGQDWFNSTNEVSLKLGEVTVPTASKEIGTGYIQHTYEAGDIKSSMGKITVGLKSTTTVTSSASSTGTTGARNSAIQTGTSSPASTSGMGWGAVYYQYFQNIDQVKAQGNGLTVSKQQFVEQPSATGTVMVPIAGQTLKPGDKVITRLIVTVDRTMDFVVLKDQRAACFEPVKQLSGYVWSEGVGYYQTSKDASTQFFFSSLPKGSYTFDYQVFVNNSGSFTDGVATLQCLYAPEFSAHSNGGRIEVKPAGK